MKKISIIAIILVLMSFCGCSSIKGQSSSNNTLQRPKTIADFTKEFDKYSLGAKIGDLSESVSNGETFLSYTDSDMTMISVGLQSDGSSIKEIDVSKDVTTTDTTTHTLGPDFISAVQNVIFLCTPNQNSMSILKKLKVVGSSYSGPDENTITCDKIKYSYFMVTTESVGEAEFVAKYL